MQKIKWGENLNTKELKKVMLDYGDSNKTLADYLGMAESTFSSKLHENGAAFRKSEMKMIIDRYKLTPAQIKLIFFS